MKTVRFSQVVAKSGKPEVYLTLVAPAKDRHLQSAIKSHRVMTVRQDNAGSKVDRGEIGFEEGPERQYLIFPRSLQRFAGQRAVGIKYDLIVEPEIAKSQLAPPAREKKRSKSKSTTPQPLAKALAAGRSDGVENEEDRPDTDEEGSEEAPSDTTPASEKQRKRAKAQAKPKHKPHSKKKRQSPHNDEITAMQKVVRNAMSELEKGKAVAAFNLLKQIADG